MISRQAQHSASKRAARGPVPLGRPRWSCPVCAGIERRNTATNQRICAACHPGRGRGRPRKPIVDAPTTSD